MRLQEFRQPLCSTSTGRHWRNHGRRRYTQWKACAAPSTSCPRTTRSTSRTAWRQASGKQLRELQKVSDILRVLIDGWTRKVQSLGRGYLANAIHGYMGHVWGNYAEWAQRLLPPTVGDVQGKAPAPLAEQPSLASKVFLKERGFPTQFEAIKAGLIPITYNPVDFQLLKLREMQNFAIDGIKLADDMKRTEVARWVPAGMERAAADEGLEPLDDRLFRLGLDGRRQPGRLRAHGTRKLVRRRTSRPAIQ